MLVLVMEDTAKQWHRSFFVNGVPLRIGRDPANHVVLSDPAVSRYHAEIVKAGGGWILHDLKSSNGTVLQGKQLVGEEKLGIGDFIQIATYRLHLENLDEVADARGIEDQTTSENKQPQPGSVQQALTQLKLEVHRELLGKLEFKRLDFIRTSDEELRSRVRDATRTLLNERTKFLPPGCDQNALVEEIVSEVLGLGPLEELIADPEVTEIMVNGASRMYVERGGKLQPANHSFSSDEHVLAVIERIVAPLGRRIDESTPMVDARLTDGSRVNAIIPPLSLTGPTLTIRKFSSAAMTSEDLIRNGTLDARMAEFLKLAVRSRRNIVVSGGTGSGKTTLLNVLSAYLPSEERIITIEDAAELRLSQEHVIQLESRPPNLEGKGMVTIRDLVRNTLRMRPDRIVVGECRGGEALDMLQAMNTGHDGSLTTVHANSPRDALSRLETMVMMAGMELPLRAIREQIASSVQVVVHMGRLEDGGRRVMCASEVLGLEDQVINMQDIFFFQRRGKDAHGRIEGEFVFTGFMPKFFQELPSRGIKIDESLFH